MYFCLSTLDGIDLGFKFPVDSNQGSVSLTIQLT
ncbi:MAG: hypothetical protein XD90_2179, partial [Methanobacterium sp. 42_16]